MARTMLFRSIQALIAGISYFSRDNIGIDSEREFFDVVYAAIAASSRSIEKEEKVISDNNLCIWRRLRCCRLELMEP